VSLEPQPETVRFYAPERELLLAAGAVAALGLFCALSTLIWLAGAVDGDIAFAVPAAPALIGAWLLDRWRRRRAVLEVDAQGIRSGPVTIPWPAVEQPRRRDGFELDDPEDDRDEGRLQLGTLTVPRTDVPIAELARYLRERREQAQGHWPGDPPAPPATTGAGRLLRWARRSPLLAGLAVGVPFAVALAGYWWVVVLGLLFLDVGEWRALMREPGLLHASIAAALGAGAGAAFHPLI
jgi:hypothetical protein